MHDTALEIGRLAIHIYAGKNARILELGSMDVNGSLRQFAPKDCIYTGVDLEPGKNVDMVVEAGRSLPFEDGAFDFILASSVFEHDPTFWVTFLDCARLLREDGHLYINAPSNGSVHRYPEDHWRFYPDSGLALERWAQSQGLPMRLVESFTAPRKSDQWNDFVAVFRRGEREDGLKGQFLHTSCDGMNVWIMGASQPLKSSEATEDMALLKQAREKISAFEKSLRSREEENAQLVQNARQQQDRLTGQLDELRHQFKSTLGERDSARTEMAVTQADLSRVQTELEQQIKAFEAKRKLLKREKKARKLLEQQLEKNERTVDQAQSQAKQSHIALKKAEDAVEERFSEIAAITKLLQGAESRVSAEKNNREWLALVHATLAEMPFLTAVLPRRMRARQRLKTVKRAGLFDGERYLELYPDVSKEAMDPLRHYILHGIAEGRKCPK
jgi:SAM-dependent methyltransferase